MLAQFIIQVILTEDDKVIADANENDQDLMILHLPPPSHKYRIPQDSIPK